MDSQNQELLAKFPLENPSPVMRMNCHGVLEFANNASSNMMGAFSLAIGKPVPDKWQEAAVGGSSSVSTLTVDCPVSDKIYSLSFFSVASVHIYIFATDVTKLRQADESLVLKEQSLAHAQSIGKMGSWDWNIVTGTLEWSRQIYKIFGIDEKEFLPAYDKFMEFVHPDDHELVAHGLKRAIEDDVPYEVEHRVVQKDGSLRVVLEQGEVYRNEEGKATRMIGTVQDITERKKAEDQRNISSKILDTAFGGVMITDPQVKIIYVNPAFTSISGYAKEDVLGKSPKILRSDRHEKTFYDKMWSSISSTGSWKGEIWNRRKSGQAYPEELCITAVMDSFGELTHYVSVFTDLSQVKESQAALKYQQDHDALTSLPNRVLFMDRLQQAISHAEKSDVGVVAIILAIDSFSRINESLGHAKGDILLQQLAERLINSVKELDTIARLGGDEFGIVLPSCKSIDEAVSISERLINVFKEPFDLDGHETYVTTSIGVSFYPDDAKNESGMMQNASTALTRVKQAGKNGYRLYKPEMNAMAVKHLELDRDMRHGIENGEFIPYYQPKIGVLSGEVESVEALARWQHPKHGLVPPDVFIALAEDSGLIVDIGDSITAQVCKDVRKWRDAGLGLRAGINLSARQFSVPELDEKIMKHLEVEGILPEDIDIEITESIVMEDVSTAQVILAKLRNAGFTISLDDFGTGHSSFAYLKRFPITTLKIDKIFVDEIVNNNDDRQIISAMISMSHNLGMDVVAEGVEDSEQLGILQEFKCDIIQGYLFSKPLPFEEVSSFVKNKDNYKII